MFFGEEDSPFQDLPPEMIVEVLNLVDLKGKQMTRLVCRRWRWILDHPNSGLLSFKQTNRKMTEDSVQYLLKSQLHFDHLVLKDLKMTWPVMTYSRNKFPHIRKLTLKPGNCSQSLTTILQYGCAQTESLTLDYSCFSLIRLDILSRVLSGMRWNQLTELEINFIPDTVGVKSLKNSRENDVKGVELIFKKARIPNLRVLTLDLFFRFGNGFFGLEMVDNGERCGEIVKMMSNFMIFLEHHSKTVKELKLSLYSDTEMLAFPTISAPLFSTAQQESVARDLKLERLDIWTTDYALVHMVPPCVLQSDNLTTLNWQPLWAPSWSLPAPGVNLGMWTPITIAMPALMAPPGTAKPMRSLIQQNQNTLTNMTIRFVNGEDDVDPFEISWLQSCPHLRQLTITNFDKFFGVKLLLPAVRKLEICLIESLESMENLSAWISRTFRNLETVQFSVYFTTQLQNWEFDWIQNLLLLPILVEIRFGFTNWLRLGHSHLPFLGPDFTASIRQYCSDKARLMFRGARQNHSGLCFIKILPIQNYN